MLTYRLSLGVLIVSLCLFAGVALAQEQAPDPAASQPGTVACVAGAPCGPANELRDTAAALAAAIRAQYGYPESERFIPVGTAVDVSASLAAAIRAQYGYPESMSVAASEAVDVSVQLAAAIRAQYGYPESMPVLASETVDVSAALAAATQFQYGYPE